jgi:DNA-directed RNA polymerase sigma subunit (sigma70/sigma32)
MKTRQLGRDRLEIAAIGYGCMGLTPREERVLCMRFGIGMNTDRTLEEVGQ